jgi:glucose-1-phosphate adenylyltransferase
MTDQNILSQTATFVRAGRRGARLARLTYKRSKPAVPFGDRRLIDFVLANCLRSNLKHPAVITQYQAARLTQHVRRWWLDRAVCFRCSCDSFPRLRALSNSGISEHGECSVSERSITGPETQYVLVLSADHVYDMAIAHCFNFTPIATRMQHWRRLFIRAIVAPVWNPRSG